MAIANFIPELWSANLLTAFRKDFVFSGLVNRNYEGEVRDKGDTVKVLTPVTIPVAARSGAITYTTPTSTTQSIVIDQDYEWAFQVGDLESVQSNVNLISTYTEEGSISMADAVDSDIAGLYTAGTAGNIAINLTTATAADFYDAIIDAGKNLNANNVPSTGRWIVISPVGYAALLKNDSKFVQATASGDSVLRNAAIGMVGGFNVFMSNNLVDATGLKYMYGHTSAITWAGQMTRFEALRDVDNWNDHVRSRLVWGRKVVRSVALGTITATES